MIPEIGHFALILSLVLAMTQVVVPLLGYYQRDDLLQRSAVMTAPLLFLCLLVSFTALGYALVVNDFSVVYVAQHSHSELPVIYRFCALWGAHEGSMLLWVFLLSGWTAMVALNSRSLSLDTRALVLVVLGLLILGFIWFILSTSNPFVRLLPTPPTNGRDLNPLLQDPGLVSHPPMLYMGYVGFAVAFAFAIVGLWQGRLDAAWARWARPWTLIAWCFLSVGIILGSWWAYRELGWGGWWFWDPVENASFMPWLAGTALIHSLVVAAKRDTFKAWTALLAICTFSLSLLGTFLVRSGVLVSVHAFAVDPERGVFILNYLAVVVGGSLLIYAWRAKHLVSAINFTWVSRESALLANNVLLTVAMLTVLLGTLYPLLIDTLGLGKLSVGPPYFNRVMLPIMTPLLFLMAAAPLVKWRNHEFQTLRSKFQWWLVAAIALALLIPWWLTGQFSAVVVLGVSLALWILLASAQQFQQKSKTPLQSWGVMLAHGGVAICVLGIVLSSVFSTSREVRMQSGDAVEIGGYQVQLGAVHQVAGPNYNAYEAHVLVKKGDAVVARLQPQQRNYPVAQMSLAKTAIDVGVFHDLYVALGQPLPGDAWAMRVYYKPFVRWIWVGGLIMVLGGLLRLLPFARHPLKKNLELADCPPQSLRDSSPHKGGSEYALNPGPACGGSASLREAKGVSHKGNQQ